MLAPTSHDAGKEHDRRVDANVVRSREVGRQQHRPGAVQAGGECNACGAADRPQHECFRQQLTGHAGAAGPEGGANGQLPQPRVVVRASCRPTRWRWRRRAGARRPAAAPSAGDARRRSRRRPRAVRYVNGTAAAEDCHPAQAGVQSRRDPGPSLQRQPEPAETPGRSRATASNIDSAFDGAGRNGERHDRQGPAVGEGDAARHHGDDRVGLAVQIRWLVRGSPDRRRSDRATASPTARRRAALRPTRGTARRERARRRAPGTASRWRPRCGSAPARRRRSA